MSLRSFHDCFFFIFRCHNLAYLSLCFCEHISEAGIELLGQTQSLCSLDISGCNCGDVVSLKGKFPFPLFHVFWPIAREGHSVHREGRSEGRRVCRGLPPKRVVCTWKGVFLQGVCIWWGCASGGGGLHLNGEGCTSWRSWSEMGGICIQGSLPLKRGLPPSSTDF